MQKTYFIDLTTHKSFPINSYVISGTNKNSHGAMPSITNFVTINCNINMYNYYKNHLDKTPSDYLIAYNNTYTMLSYAKLTTIQIDYDTDIASMEFKVALIDIDELHNLSKEYNAVKKLYRLKKIDELLLSEEQTK